MIGELGARNEDRHPERSERPRPARWKETLTGFAGFASRHDIVWRGVMIATVIVVLAIAAESCTGDAAAHGQTPTVARVEEVSDSSLVTVRQPERFPLVAVATRGVPDRLSGTCVVSPDVNRSVPVSALGSGRVVDLEASLGDHVHKGQLLVTIDSPDLSQALADHAKAVADAALAERQLDRSRVLLAHGTIAEKDLEAAEDAAQKAGVDARATEDRVRLLGGDPARPTPLIELRAPVDGTIVEQNVTRAAAVKSPDSAPNLFTIADLSRVWVLCDVYENELARARVGEVARVRLAAYPDRTYAGRIGNISPVLDPVTRTAKLRVELDNTAGTMRLGMFALAELDSPSPRQGMVIPSTAVVQLHDADWVFVQVGATTYRRVLVRSAGEVQPGVLEIASGVEPGQQIVRDALPFVATVEQ